MRIGESEETNDFPLGNTIIKQTSHILTLFLIGQADR